MDLSIYLAKVIGLYLFIVCFGFLVNKKNLKPIVTEFLKSPPLIFLSGFMALIIGLLLVTSHNVWVMGWPVLITIFGWLSLIKGIIRVVCPQFVVKKVQKWFQNDAFYYITCLIFLIAGLILIYYGYIGCGDM